GSLRRPPGGGHRPLQRDAPRQHRSQRPRRRRAAPDRHTARRRSHRTATCTGQRLGPHEDRRSRGSCDLRRPRRARRGDPDSRVAVRLDVRLHRVRRRRLEPPYRGHAGHHRRRAGTGSGRGSLRNDRPGWRGVGSALISHRPLPAPPAPTERRPPRGLRREDGGAMHKWIRHAHASRGAMLALLGGTVTSCGSGHPAFHHAVFPGLERYDEQHMRSAFETPLVLPPTLRAAVLWVDQTADGSEPALPESARTRVLDRFQHALLAPPLVGISLLPTMLAANGTASIDLDTVRSAASHMQSDVAILVLTTSEHTVDWNALALTYPALVTTVFVPGDDLHVDLSAQACAIDV